MAIVARFKPDHEGGYLGGVPARSLDEDDFKALTDDQKAAVKASKLYTMVDSAEKPATPSPVAAAPKPAG